MLALTQLKVVAIHSLSTRLFSWLYLYMPLSPLTGEFDEQSQIFGQWLAAPLTSYHKHQHGSW